jgi:hypothetical protein
MTVDSYRLDPMTLISARRHAVLAWAMIVLAVVATGCEMVGHPDPRRIEAVFPVLERLHVTAFRNQDWCQNLAYAGGAFSKTDSHSTCDLFFEAPRDFDDRASADFATVAGAFSDAGAAPDFVNVRFRNDRVADVEVAFWNGSLIYDADGVTLSSDSGAGTSEERLSDRWEWDEGE